MEFWNQGSLGTRWNDENCETSTRGRFLCKKEKVEDIPLEGSAEFGCVRNEKTPDRCKDKVTSFFTDCQGRRAGSTDRGMIKCVFGQIVNGATPCIPCASRILTELKPELCNYFWPVKVRRGVPIAPASVECANLTSVRKGDTETQTTSAELIYY